MGVWQCQVVVKVECNYSSTKIPRLWFFSSCLSPALFCFFSSQVNVDIPGKWTWQTMIIYLIITLQHFHKSLVVAWWVKRRLFVVEIHANRVVPNANFGCVFCLFCLCKFLRRSRKETSKPQRLLVSTTTVFFKLFLSNWKPLACGKCRPHWGFAPYCRLSGNCSGCDRK